MSPENKSSLLDDLTQTTVATKAWASALGKLLKLDLELAAVSASRILVYCIVAALLGVALVFICLLAFGYWLYLSGVSPLIILLTSGGLLGLMTVFAVLRIMALAKNVSLRETRRQLFVVSKSNQQSDPEIKTGAPNATSA